jgi:hypothetical protein
MKLKLDKQSKTALFIILGYFVLLSVLAYFRFAIYDEKLYLHETAMMSEVLKQGEWIGRYGVGVHGFLFKLPVALVYLITGPSIYIATFFHIILSAISAWLFYLFTKRFFKDKWMPVWALVILITNFSYVSWSTTFHREIPVLFATMLFIYFYTKEGKGRPILNGFLLLLILDAKEYVFFMLLPAIIIHTILVGYSKNKNILKIILFSLKRVLLLLTPSLLYLFLMFYTTLLPINMFNASLLGLTEGGMSYQVEHLSAKKSLVNTYTQSNSNLTYNSSKTTLENSKIVKILTLPFSYIEKLFYISNFSFQYIPLVLLIPSLASSLYILQIKKKRNLFLFPIISYWCYLLIFILRTSQGRYLFPVIPLYIMFFTLFLLLQKNEKKKFKPYFKTTLFLMTLASIVTLFYQDPTTSKELFNIFATLSFTGLFYLLYYCKKHNDVITKLTMLAIIIASLFITTYALFTKNQVYQSLKWGINGEAKKIAELLEPEDVIFVNYSNSYPTSKFTYLLKFYKAKVSLPIEWNWRLDRNKITRKLDKKEVVQEIFLLAELTNTDKFKEKVYENNINKIVLLKSEIKGELFPLQDYIGLLKEEDWLKIQKVVPMKNKSVYIFEVIP